MPSLCLTKLPPHNLAHSAPALLLQEPSTALRMAWSSSAGAVPAPARGVAARLGIPWAASRPPLTPRVPRPTLQRMALTATARASSPTTTTASRGALGSPQGESSRGCCCQPALWPVTGHTVPWRRGTATVSDTVLLSWPRVPASLCAGTVALGQPRNPPVPHTAKPAEHTCSAARSPSTGVAGTWQQAKSSYTP